MLAKDGGAEAQAEQTLFAEWEGLLKYRDFASFSKRMEAIRRLGRLRTPKGSELLRRVMRDAKVVDDRVVALMALGPQLDLEAAKEVGALVGRRKEEVLDEALGQAYALAQDPDVLAWLAEGALRRWNWPPGWRATAVTPEAR